MIMAAIDYLKEHGFIREIDKKGYVAGQDREFIILINKSLCSKQKKNY